jgi:energy-coupling factor transporter ATP-binding protein EcfA2
VLEIAAAGGHNLLMIGAPGSGKSMLAARLPSILPPLTPEEMLEVSMVHSLAGELLGGRIATHRPFRAPHHSASMAALVGGGSKPRPGEVSLAHLGVLFLDEFPEFLGLMQQTHLGDFWSDLRLSARFSAEGDSGGPAQRSRRTSVKVLTPAVPLNEERRRTLNCGP